MKAIVVENLVKQYKNGVLALDGISFHVQAGEIFSLLGQNGAGKSTLIQILTTFLRPTSGSAAIFGKDILTAPSAVRSKVARVAQSPSIDTYLSLTENMMFQSSLYHIPKLEAKKRMEGLIASFGLEQYLKSPVSSYSGGIKRRLDIALGMMANPDVLFLDEPTVGMDLQSRKSMWEMMKKIREDFGTTIFLTTHYLEEADLLSDTICIMKDGKEVVQGTSKQLRGYLRKNMLKIQFVDRNTLITGRKWLSGIFAGRYVETAGNTVLVSSEEGSEDLARAAYLLLEKHIAFTGIQIAQPDIEDVFVHLTENKEERP